MNACDYVMPDFMRMGGVTGWQRAAAIAAAAGIPISTHLYPEVAAHVMRVSETAYWLEWQDWANPIFCSSPTRSKMASCIKKRMTAGTQCPGIRDADLSSLQLIIYGASPIPTALLRSALEVFKCNFAQVYGSETRPADAAIT
jgi:hypothetical protein